MWENWARLSVSSMNTLVDDISYFTLVNSCEYVQLSNHVNRIQCIRSISNAKFQCQINWPPQCAKLALDIEIKNTKCVRTLRERSNPLDIANFAM